MRSWRAALGALVVASGLATLAARPAKLPGMGAPGHATIAGDCLACHTALAGTAVAKCAACHSGDSIADLRSAPSDSVSERTSVAGLHRAIAGRACAGCHAAHAGSDSARARPAFSHTMVSAAWRARCDDCHRNDHPTDDLHRGVTGCGACHSLRAWKPATLDHATHFVLDRDHAAPCARCHLSRDGGGPYNCFGCHEHTPESVAAQHRDGRARDPGDCARCHGRDRQDRERIERHRHGDRGEPDHHEGREKRGDRGHGHD